MKSSLVFLCVVLAVCAYDLDELKFKLWMKQHHKVYSTTEEYQKRLQFFKGNLVRNAELNARPGQTANYGLNQFSDMTYDEFRSSRLMKPFQVNNTCRWPYHRVHREYTPEELGPVPSSWDWRTKGAVTPIKNQGSCGSCWTFSTAENIEGMWFLAGNPIVSLSEQWVVDCSHSCLASEPDLCNGGCGGGLPWLAYEDIITNKFLTTEQAYPYTGEAGTCQSPSTVGAKISNWTAVSTDPTQITAFCYNEGPLSITLNAGLLFSYTSGIITGTPDDCPNDESDHAVLLVGFGVDTTNNNMPYWIVKNSWGNTWGESGYFRIESDNGLCGINACVTSSIV